MKTKTIAILIALTVVVAACKEKEDYTENADGRTSYTVIGQVPSIAADMLSSATVYEYDRTDTRIDSNIISNPSSGTSYLFYPADEATHLKVKLISKADTYRWGDTIVMLQKGKNVNITISITSPTAMNEPRL